MQPEENTRIEEGKKEIEIEEQKIKIELNNELTEIETKNFKKKTDNFYLYIMDFLFIIITPFVLISLCMGINWINTTLAIVCGLMYLGINIEQKAISKEQERRKESEKEETLKIYKEKLERLDEKRKEFLTKEEKETIRLAEEENKKQQKLEEEVKMVEQTLQEIINKIDAERKRKKIISTLETIRAVTHVLNMILDIVLCIVFLPLGLLACFLTAVARSSNKKH